MSSLALQKSRQLWIWSALVWFGFGLADAFETVFVMRAEGMHHNWTKLFVVTIFFWLPWALATVPVIHLGRRFPPVRLRPVTTWVVHLLAPAVIGLIFTVWTTWLERSFDLYGSASSTESFRKLSVEKFLSGSLSSLIFYTGILATSYILESRARFARHQTETALLNEQLTRLQLEALRRQIEPHFLFNTLNAVSGLVRAGEQETAITTIAALSDFLRHTLENSARQQVPLEEEMDFTEKYLSIQKIRFADRLRLDMRVPPELGHAQVPSLILQPIVENAVKHGIAKRAHGGTIRIVASRTNATLTLTVRNDGPNLRSTDLASAGVGSANVRTRLTTLYGSAFDFSMRNVDSGGVEVSVSIPFVPTPGRDIQ